MTDESFPETVDVRSNPSSRFSVLENRYPPPWTVAVLADSFVIRDAQLRPLGYVYFSDLGHNSSKSLTRDEAWQLAANITMIPDLIKRAFADRRQPSLPLQCAPFLG
jgi:hypothetical protein